MEALGARVGSLRLGSSASASSGTPPPAEPDAIAAMHDALQRRKAQVNVDAEHARALAEKQRQFWAGPARRPSTSASAAASTSSVPLTLPVPVPSAPDLARSASCATNKTSDVSMHSVNLAVPSAAMPPTTAPQPPAAGTPGGTNPLSPSIPARAGFSAHLASPLNSPVSEGAPPGHAHLAGMPAPPPAPPPPPPWGTLTPEQVQYDQVIHSSLGLGPEPAAQPSLLRLRNQLVRLYPQVGTRAMVGLQGTPAPTSSPGGASPLPLGIVPLSFSSTGGKGGVGLDEDRLPLPLWRADEPGSAAGDSVGALFPPDARGHVPSSAAALYVQTQGLTGAFAASNHSASSSSSSSSAITPPVPSSALDEWGVGIWGPDSWPAVKAEATDTVQGYPLTEKQRRKVADKLSQREKDLGLEVTSMQDRAEVLLTIYTEQRQGEWRVRRPVHVGPDDQIALETPHAMDPWTVSLDSVGIIARNKLRSMMELSATRMNVRCPKCSLSSRGAGPLGSDEEWEEDEVLGGSGGNGGGGGGGHADERSAQYGNGVKDSLNGSSNGNDGVHCSVCQDLRAVEMSLVITVTLRVASFLPLPLPCMHLAGRKEDHLRYQPDHEVHDPTVISTLPIPSTSTSFTEAKRESFLRRRTVEGAINAANRVGRQHYTQHRARLLCASAVVRRTRGVSFSMYSHKAKSSRTFDALDPWPRLPVPPGADPQAPPYNPIQVGQVMDTSPARARAQAMAFLQAQHQSPGQGTFPNQARHPMSASPSPSSVGTTSTHLRAQGSYFPPMSSPGTGTGIGTGTGAGTGANPPSAHALHHSLSNKFASLRTKTRSRSRGSPSLRSNPTSPAPPSTSGTGTVNATAIATAGGGPQASPLSPGLPDQQQYGPPDHVTSPSPHRPLSGFTPAQTQPPTTPTPMTAPTNGTTRLHLGPIAGLGLHPGATHGSAPSAPGPGGHTTDVTSSGPSWGGGRSPSFAAGTTGPGPGSGMGTGAVSPRHGLRDLFTR